jgi:hypothetical protein
VLYMSGSSNFPPLLAKLAPAISQSLAANGLPPIAPVFKTTSSCAGVQAVYPDQTKPATTSRSYYPAHLIHDPTSPTDSYPQYFDPVTGQLARCSLGPAGAPVDIGESEIFPETCSMTRDDINVSETLGPKLAILFVAPAYTDQKVISSEAAREVFGSGGLSPWTVPSLFYVRGAGTATLQLVSNQIGVSPNKFWGIDQGTAQALAENLGSIFEASVAREAIGLLGADFYDRNRANLKALAFQATDQDCAYTPDSNSNSVIIPKDKINVRDGHYPIWGPVHLFGVKINGQALTSAVTNFAGLFGAPRLPVVMLDAFIDASFVPDCAMKVRRESELGPMTSTAPVVSCGCHFDSRVNPKPNFVPPGCTPCLDNSDCVSPSKPECIYGFCEVAAQ